MERAVAAAIESAWKVSAEKLKAGDGVDYLLRREQEAKAYMEVKCRTHDYGTYDTYTISTFKLTQGRISATSAKLPLIIAVSFNGSIYWVDYMNLGTMTITKGGRYDRGDAADVEWMTHIPIREFKRLTK